jgi:CelD/BcsL family acetyltransferase involved in cellulose biosynthesis
VSTYEELQEISPRWDELVASSENTSFFSTAGFTRAWWRAYQQSRNMHVAIVEENDGSFRLIAPFQAEKTNPTRWESVGTNLITYNPFIVRRDDHEALQIFLKWLHDQPGWSKIVLRTSGDATLSRFLRPSSVGASSFRKWIPWLKLNSFLIEQTVRKDHPYISQSSLSSMTNLLKKRNFRYSMNVLKREGVPGYKITMDMPEIKKHFPHLCELHIAEWGSRGRKSQFTDPETRNFYMYLCDEMASYGTLGLEILTVGDKTAAMGIHSKWKNRIESWITCFNLNFADAGPGRLLLGHLIQAAISDGITEVDLGRGLQRHKLEYTQDFRETVILVIHRSPVHAFITKLKARTPSQKQQEVFKN